MLEIIKKTLEVGLGAVSVTQEKLKEITDDLVLKGNLSRKEGSDFLKELKGIADNSQKKLKSLIEDQVHKVIKDIGIATRSDIKALEGKIKKLEVQLSRKAPKKASKPRAS